MDKTSSSYLRILKSTWGIFLKITASSEKIVKTQEVESNVIFENQLQNIRLEKTELHLLQAGIEWIRPSIESKLNYPIKITLKEIEFNHCDYQEEGMFYGIALWASEHFKFDLPIYKINFDKETKKYNFPDLDLLLRNN